MIVSLDHTTLKLFLAAQTLIRKELRESDAKHQRELNVTGFPDGHRAVAPPEPMPNSEVKRSIADGSVGLPHVRVGHCQVLIQSLRETGGFFFIPSRGFC